MSSLIFPVGLWQGPLEPQRISACHLLSSAPIFATATTSGLLFLWDLPPSSCDSNPTEREDSLPNDNNGEEEGEEDEQQKHNTRWQRRRLGGLSPRLMALAHETEITALASLPFRGSSEALLSFSSEGSLGIWEVTDGLCLEAQNGVLRNSPTFVRVLADERHVACCGRHSEIEILDLFTMKVVSRLVRPDDWLVALQSTALAVDDQPTQEALLLLGIRNTFQFWGLPGRRSTYDETSQVPQQPTRSPLFTTHQAGEGGVEQSFTSGCSVGIYLSEDLTLLLLLSAYGANVLEAGTFIPLLTLQPPLQPGDSFSGATFLSGDDHRVLLWTKRGSSFLFEILAEKALVPVSWNSLAKAKGQQDTEALESLKAKLICASEAGDSSPFREFFFCTNGQLLVASDFVGNLRLWTVASSMPLVAEGSLYFTWKAGNPEVTASLIVEDNMSLVRGFGDGSLSISQLPVDRVSKMIRAHKARVCCLLSAAKQFIVSGASDGSIRVWDSSTLDLICHFAQHSQAVTHLFNFSASSTTGSPDGSDRGSFFSVSSDKSIALYSLQNMVCKRVFANHTAQITHVRLRRDHDYLIVGCADGSLSYWEISTGMLEARIYGRGMAEVSETCEDVLRDWRPKNIQSKCITTVAVPSAPIQIILLNIKRILQELQNRLKPTAADRTNEHLSLMKEPFYNVLSYLIPWGVDAQLDQSVSEDLGLSKFPDSTSFGIRGALGKLSFSFPSAVPRRWSVSGTLTGLLSLAGATLTKALLFGAEKNSCCQLLDYFCESAPRATNQEPFVEPSLLYLARYWQDPIDDVMQFARSLFTAALRRKSLEDVSRLAKSMSLQLRSDSAQIARTKSLRTIVLAIATTERPNAFDKEVVKQVAVGLMKLLMNDAVPPMQGAAVELIGRGYSHWSGAIKDPTPVLQKLFSLVAQSKHKSTAQQALLNIGITDTSQFITYFVEEVLRKSFAPHQHNSAIAIVGSLIKKNPLALLPELPRLIDAVIKSLDPSDLPRRESLLKSTTAVLHAIVKRYPMITFHQETQRLAAGTGNLLAVYDLKSATRSALVKGHQGTITACEFANDGRHLATYSLEESKVLCWQTVNSFWMMTGGQPRLIASFDVARPKGASSPERLLNEISLEWPSPKSLVLRTGEDSFKFTVEG